MTTVIDPAVAQDAAYPWPAPSNHTLMEHSPEDPLPFAPGYFDVVTSRRFTATVPASAWLSRLQGLERALRAGGWLEIQTLDAGPGRAGPLLTSWLEHRLLPGLAARGLVARPSEMVLDYLEIAGFDDIKACKIALPTVVRAEDADAVRVMVQAGRHYYAELYAAFLGGPRAAQGWWGNKSVRAECEREGALLGLMISFGQKP